ncbi:hypothetical protein AQJ91_38190 [Streptomyces dysideae]|uniref:Integral-membrane protein n=1 Tax=Streptomyces dysideae TaxID=909626 RepID=A0A101USH2_9ACTN|nr:hypothetical protein AQJ91_38190 [Streptomyces dysideae]
MFAAVCVLLAALGHVLMSGHDVPAPTLAAGVTVTGGVGWWLAARERGLPLIVAVVVGAQTLLHSAFSLTEPTDGAARSSGGVGSAHVGSAHMHSMPSMSTDAMDAGHMGTAEAGGDTLSSGMLAAHLLAALLCGLWLAYGERAAFRILRALAGWLAAPLRLLLALPTPPHRPRLRPHRRRSDRAPRLLLLSHAITTRGPPLGTAAA